MEIYNFAEEEAAAAAPDEDGSQERVGNTAWCMCGHGSAMPTTVESICCREADVDCRLGELSCITLSRTFQMLCCERDVLEVSMLSLREVRAEIGAAYKQQSVQVNCIQTVHFMGQRTPWEEEQVAYSSMCGEHHQDCFPISGIPRL